MSRRSSTGSSRRAARADGARILHLDAFSGVAGNMFVAALLDAGLARRELEAERGKRRLGQRDDGASPVQLAPEREHLRLEIRELREGFRPGPIVSFRPQGLPQVKLPPEEHVQNMADR